MIFVNPADIIIPPNRFREEFPERYLAELSASIREFGLFYPLTVERRPEDDKWTLRDGECRLRVLQPLVAEHVQLRCGADEVPAGTVPVIEWDKLTPFQRLAIEVEANIRRRDFNFQERSRALAAFHEFRKQQNPTQTMQQTATEINRKPAQGDQIAEVSDAIIIAKHLNDPDVAKAKDAKEAIKIIRRKAEAIHRAKLALHFDISKTPHKLIHGNAHVILPTMPANSFDVILTDPPYGVGADNFGDQSGTGHDYEDSPKYLEELFAWIPEETYRVAKVRAHCYLFCDVRRFERIATLMVLACWKVFPTPLIWYKGNGMVPLPKHGPKRSYECILYAYKGDRETLMLKNDCIVRVPGVRTLKHGAQKPVALYCDLLSRSANPGDTVLDFMGGSGTILVAANRSKLTATYIEQQEAAYNIAVQRVHTVEIDDGAEEDDGIRIDLS